MPKLNALEGLRGLAACMVIYCHFLYLLLDQFNQVISNCTGKWFAPLALFFSDGTQAVYVFWTMSALVITRNLWPKTDLYILKVAFLKRYIRLAIPILASIVLVMILFELNLLFSGEFSKIQGASFNRGWLHGMYQFRLSWPEAMYEGIIGTLFHYNKEHIYNSVLWTMEKEWWGSVGCFIYIILRKKSPYATLIYPIIMGVAMKTGQTWIICFAGGLAISEITTYADIDSPQTVFSKLNQLLHYFFSGRTGFILLIAAIFIARYKNYFGLMNPAIAEILVCLALYHKGFVSFLSSRWLVRLGTLSFGFYLIHMPVICSLSCYLLSIGQPIYIVLFSSLSVIVLSGMLFQKYIDKPAVMLSGKLNTFAQNEN